MSLVCTLRAIREEDAAALRQRSLYPRLQREPMPWGCAVISLPAFAIPIALLWRLLPSLFWLWCIVFGGFWFAINGMHRRLLNAIRTSRSRPSQPTAPTVPPLLSPESTADELELDKTWHGLHYLLTGNADNAPQPLGYLLAGGEEVGDLSDGPARLLDPRQLQQFHEAVSAVTLDELRDRFNAEKMATLEIYPNTWNRPGEFEWLVVALERLRSFLEEQATAGNRCLIITLG